MTPPREADYDIEPGDLDTCQNCGSTTCDGASCYDFNPDEAEDE